MSDSRIYYYLKIKDNFFESEKIKVISTLPNGDTYIMILMQIYLRSLKRDGKLMMTDRIPFSVETLSKVIGRDSDNVRAAIQIFQEFDLVEILDNGAMYMMDIQNFIGKSTTEADRKREYRNRINDEKELLLEKKETGQMSDICLSDINKASKLKKD